MPDDTAFWLLIAAAAGLYFLPTIIAFNRRPRKHPQRWVILVCNFLFGFTGIGWLMLVVISLVNLDPNKKGDAFDRFIYDWFVDDGEERMKKCSYCAEQIKEDASVCRYCGRDQPSSRNTSSKEDIDSFLAAAAKSKPRTS